MKTCSKTTLIQFSTVIALKEYTFLLDHKRYLNLSGDKKTDMFFSNSL